MVDSDHHRCDVMVEHEGKYVRPWLTCWQDLRSRKIVGWSIYAHDPNADVILRCFVDAAAACGVPRVVYIDNGRDYDSRALQGITKKQRRTAALLGESDRQKIGGAFGMLNIDVHHALPYHAQSKPIERFFGTLESRFGKSFETYCGKDPQSKPEDLPKQLVAGKAPKLAEFAEAFAAWLAADYNAQPHSGDAMEGQSPDQVFESLRGEIKTAPRDLLLFATLPRVGPVKIGQHGVRWQGLNYGSGTPDLQKRFGQKVMLAIDDRDIERVLILDLDGRLICTAPLNKQLPFGATKQDMRETMAAQKRDRRRQQEYFDRQPRMAEDRLAALTRRTVEKKRAQGLPPGAEPPPIIKPIRLPFEDQSRQIAAALGEKPMRLAAGAESMHNGREVFMDAVMSRHDAGDVDRAGDRGFMDALAMAVTSTRRDGQ